ncbi:RNA-binding S4 domain-containing protein [Natronospora cellulosivora (SeqCode)]
MENIKIKTKKIQLDQFLKWANLVASGGEAKELIQSANVSVNGEIDTRRSRKLTPGDIVEVKGDNNKYQVTEA